MIKHSERKNDIITEILLTDTIHRDENLAPISGIPWTLICMPNVNKKH